MKQTRPGVGRVGAYREKLQVFIRCYRNLVLQRSVHNQDRDLNGCPLNCTAAVVLTPPNTHTKLNIPALTLTKLQEKHS